MQRQTAKQKIINAAQQLMVGQGYTATTVDEIVACAGVAKGSFYHAFASKETLALVALEDYFKRGMGVIGGGNYRHEPDAVRRLYGFMDYVQEIGGELWQHGCLLGSITLELADSYPKLIDKVDALFQEMEARIASLFQPALEAKGIKNPTGEALGRHMLVVIEGAIIMAKSHRNTGYLNEALNHFRAYVDAIMS